MELKITSFSPKADKLFSKNSTIEKIAEGYKFTEGPVWDIKNDCLYFTDFQDSIILKWTKEAGVELYTDKANRAIGLYMNAEGKIVSTESSEHCIAYVDDKSSEMVTNNYQGKRLNSPNDVIVIQNGDICFTDPFSAAVANPREVEVNGVYRVTPKGETRLLCGDINRPNGLAFSVDESIFYVNDTDLQQIFAFDVNEDGSVSNKRVFATLDKSFGPGAPDGMRVDTEDNVWVTGPGGIWVLSNSGEPIAIVHVPEYVGNFCFGGKDSKTLYITASKSVYSAEVLVAGVVPYRD